MTTMSMAMDFRSRMARYLVNLAISLSGGRRSASVVSTDLRLNWSPQMQRQTSVLLNAAAQIRGRALASGMVEGVDEVEGFDWHRVLLLTGRNLYLYDRAYWRITREPARQGDMPPTLTIEIYKEGDVRRQNDGTFRVGNEIAPPEEIVAIESYQEPSSASERLRKTLDIEKSLFTSWDAQTNRIVEPRYIFRSPDNSIPSEPKKLEDHKKRIESGMRGPIFLLYENELLEAISPQADPESHARIEEVRRTVAVDSGIPPQLLGTKLDSSHRNFETLMRHFYEDVVLHEAKRVMSAVRAQGAFPEFGIKFEDHYALAQTRSENAAELRTRTLAARDLTQAGISPEDALEMVGLAA